jgi:hypothetical protein
MRVWWVSLRFPEAGEVSDPTWTARRNLGSGHGMSHSNTATARRVTHPQADMALERVIVSLEEAMSLLPPDDDYRPALLQIRTALLARLERAPLAAVPRR